MEIIGRIALALAVFLASAAVWSPAAGDAQTPPTASGFSGVISIPVEDPSIHEITGSLFKPPGAGPFPVVIYMSGSDGVANDYDRALQKVLIEHFRSRNLATLILDPFTRRGETGVTGKLVGSAAQIYYRRGARDFLAAAVRLSMRPDIDGNGIFLQGYSYGAGSALFATSRKNYAGAAPEIAGVIAFYPPCCGGLSPGVPTLVLTGAQDHVFASECCLAVPDLNLQVVVYPGVTHNFALPGLLEGDYFGSHQAFDKQAVEDAQRRIDVFIDRRRRAPGE